MFKVSYLFRIEILLENDISPHDIDRIWINWDIKETKSQIISAFIAIISSWSNLFHSIKAHYWKAF